jgi:hypothetical protein
MSRSFANCAAAVSRGPAFAFFLFSASAAAAVAASFLPAALESSLRSPPPRPALCCFAASAFAALRSALCSSGVTSPKRLTATSRAPPPCSAVASRPGG